MVWVMSDIKAKWAPLMQLLPVQPISRHKRNWGQYEPRDVSPSNIWRVCPYISWKNISVTPTTSALPAVREPRKPKQPFGNSGTSNWILRISSPHIPSKPFLQIKYSPTKVHKPPHLSFHTHIHILQDISFNLLLLTRSLAYSAGLLFFKEVSEKEGQRAVYGANFEAPCGWYGSRMWSKLQ